MINLIKINIYFIVLIILSLNPSINFASKKNNNNILNKKLEKNSLEFIDYILISKDSTLKKLETFSKAYNSHIGFLERKIVIRKDYLKLIKIFPNKKNIKKDALIEEIKILENKKDYFLNIYQNKIMKDLQFFRKENEFSFYKVRYTYKIIDKKNKANIFNWVSFCPINDNDDMKLNPFRQKLLNSVYTNNFLQKKLNTYNIQRDLYDELNEFEIDKIICNDFRNILKTQN